MANLNLPIEFDSVRVVKNSSLHLSFNFDIISSIQVNQEGTLDITQKTPIKATEISLGGRTSNPNISVSINAVTRLFTLNAAYITDLYPRIKDDPKTKCFIIEGYSIENVTKEKVLLCLPMSLVTNTTNVFHPLENAIMNRENNLQLNLNQYIPKSDIKTDYYNYYTNTDEVGNLIHVVFFSQSELGYTSAFTTPVNPPGYTTNKVVVVSKTTTLALNHTNMTTQFEDNIYIDCVPVDVVNQEEKNYLQINKTNATYLTDFLTLLCSMFAIGIIVYGIYYFYIYMSTPTKEVTP
jgi:hypothetical protein